MEKMFQTTNQYCSRDLISEEVDSMGPTAASLVDTLQLEIGNNCPSMDDIYGNSCLQMGFMKRKDLPSHPKHIGLDHWIAKNTLELS